MTRLPHILEAMTGILRVFEARCSDTSTIRELIDTANDKARWRSAKGLFDKIKHKSRDLGDTLEETTALQYQFEEVCAKTLYNLTRPGAPFDPDVAFRIIPLAVALGRRLGIEDAVVISPALELKS